MSVWVEIDGGFVLASEIAAIVEVEESYEQERPSKGITETHYVERLVVITKGGSRLGVGGSWSGARAFLDKVARILDPVEVSS